MSTSAVAIQDPGARATKRATVLVELAEDRQPWEQQDKESLKLFNYFKIYLEMPPPRTIRGAFFYWKEFIAGPAAKGKIAVEMDQHWYEWARIWQWKARSEAWDSWQIETSLRRRERERLEAQIQRYEMRQRVIEETYKMLDAVDPNNNKWIDNFGRLVEASMKLNEDSRKEYGDDARLINQNVSVTFADLVKMSGVDGLTTNETAIRDQDFERQSISIPDSLSALESGNDYVDAEFSEITPEPTEIQPSTPISPEPVSPPGIEGPQPGAKKSEIFQSPTQNNLENSEIMGLPFARLSGNSEKSQDFDDEVGDDLKESVEYLAMTYRPKYGEE
jgi:hypothetical protein